MKTFQTLSTINFLHKRISQLGLKSFEKAEYYSTTVISYSDYYPFGMLMPNRHGSDDDYRYGFNGMEKDDEVRNTKGASYDFGARMLDPRIGRWLSVDPLKAKFPSLNPYNFVANMPVIAVDPDGKDIFIVIYTTKKNDVGHAAFAVENYKKVVTKITEEVLIPHDNLTYEQIKSGDIGTWVTRTREVTKMVKDGTLTFYELGPASPVGGKGEASDNVTAKFGKRIVTLDELKNSAISIYESKSPDGIIKLETDYETDKKIHQALGVDYVKNKQTCEYNGEKNNCSDYAGKAADMASGEKISKKQLILYKWFSTPNKLYRRAKKAKKSFIIPYKISK